MNFSSQVKPVHSPLRILGLSLYGSQAASHRVRLSQFQPGLAAYGIELHINSLLDNDYLLRSFSGRRLPYWGVFSSYIRRIWVLLHASSNFDLAIVYGDLLPFFPGWLERYLLQIPYVYDLDDAFFLKYRAGRFRFLSNLLGSKFDLLMADAFVVTAGNAGLSSYAGRFNPNVIMLPSVVDSDQLSPAPLSRSLNSRHPFTVGWIGSPSTAPYLQLLIEPLQQLARDIPVRFLVVGYHGLDIEGVEVVEQPWSLELEAPLIQQFDVGVMPLPDTPWTRGKCAYKLLQCMACGIPVVASSVGANVDVVPPSCGFLVDSSQQWLAAFRELAADPALRQRLGAAARNWVVQHYSLRSALPRLCSVIQSASESHL